MQGTCKHGSPDVVLPIACDDAGNQVAKLRAGTASRPIPGASTSRESGRTMRAMMTSALRRKGLPKISRKHSMVNTRKPRPTSAQQQSSDQLTVQSVQSG